MEVERRDPALDVGVVHDHLVGPHVHGPVGVAQELLEQLRLEARAVELEVLEVLGLDQPAGAVVAEHQPVAVPDAARRGRLDGREPVPDHLEDEVGAGHGEHHHHHPGRARRELEPLLRVAQAVQEVAVELRLAVLVVAQGDVELGDRLARHQQLQRAGEPVRRVEVDVEVRAREAEEDADVVLVRQDRVHRSPATSRPTR